MGRSCLRCKSQCQHFAFHFANTSCDGAQCSKGLSANLTTQKKKGLEKSASAVAWWVECSWSMHKKPWTPSAAHIIHLWFQHSIQGGSRRTRNSRSIIASHRPKESPIHNRCELGICRRDRWASLIFLLSSESDSYLHASYFPCWLEGTPIFCHPG